MGLYFYCYFGLFVWTVARLGLWPCEGLRPTPVIGTLGCAPVKLTFHICFSHNLCRPGGIKIYHSPPVNLAYQPPYVDGWPVNYNVSHSYIVPRN